MFKTQVKTITTSRERSYGHATCDRCGHVMDEADHRSGYNNLTLLRFRAGFGSKFGDGNLIEGDFCDACLYELLARHVRVVDDRRTPDSGDFFRFEAPKRLYAEHQLAHAFAQGAFTTMQHWIEQAFAADLPRRQLMDSHEQVPTAGDSSESDA